MSKPLKSPPAWPSFARIVARQAAATSVPTERLDEPMRSFVMERSLEAFVTNSDAIEATGFGPQTPICFDRSPAAIEAITSGDIALIELSPANREPAHKLIRYCVTPDIFTTCRPGSGFEHLFNVNEDEFSIRILGVAKLMALADTIAAYRAAVVEPDGTPSPDEDAAMNARIGAAMRAVLGYKASGPSDALALMRLAVRRFEWNVPEGEVAGQSYADDLSDLPLSEFDYGLLLSAVRALERQGTA